MLVMMAFRNLFRNQKRSILSGLTIIAGFLLLTNSYAIVNGTFGSIIKAITDHDVGHIQMHQDDYLDKPSLNTVIVNYQDLLKRIDLPMIKSITPRILGSGLSYSETKSIAVRIEGWDFTKEEETTGLPKNITIGKLPKNEKEVLVGAKAFKNLKLNINDEITIISQGADGSIANDTFLVSGVIGKEDDRRALSVVMNIDMADQFFYLEGSIHELVIRLDSYTNTAKATTLLNDIFKDELTIDPWTKIEADFYKTLETENMALTIINMIVTFFVSMGILNVVLMTILERSHEFGVLRALGTKPTSIIFLIISETIVLVIFSFIVGLIIGLPLNLYLEFIGFKFKEPLDFAGVQITGLRAAFTVFTFVRAFLFIGFAGIIFSVIPAFYSSRSNILKLMAK